MDSKYGTNPGEVLHRVWGYESFRAGQEDLINAVLDGQDALGVLPTGAGKSLTYQLPALMLEGVTLVVSPLVALMGDQVRSLSDRGIPALDLSGRQSSRKFDQHMTDIEHHRYKMVFLSPERLLSDRFRSRALALNVSLIAVDEAHCVSEWGHDFRPEYRKIPEVYESLGRPTILAVTATATPEVERDIKKVLCLDKPISVCLSFDRPNLSFSVFRDQIKERKLIEVLNKVPGTCIVYAPTRRRTEQVASMLQSAGVTAEVYHAGRGATERSDIQRAWLDDSIRCIVATTAFGMGVDKPDVRLVVHMGLPMSLEGYYQEAGRAGRDGKKAYAVLLADEKDVADRRSWIQSSQTSAKDMITVFNIIASLNGVAVGSDGGDSVDVDMDRVSSAARLPARRVASALAALVRQEILSEVPGNGSERVGAGRVYRIDGRRPEKVRPDRQELRKRYVRDRKNLENLVRFIGARSCRRVQLCLFFGDNSAQDCGMCDNCLDRHAESVPDPGMKAQLRKLLEELYRAERETASEDSTGFARPVYRESAMLDWLALHGYIEYPEDPAGCPTLTAVGKAVVLD